jgi:hypothetical protein
MSITIGQFGTLEVLTYYYSDFTAGSVITIKYRSWKRECEEDISCICRLKPLLMYEVKVCGEIIGANVRDTQSRL